MWFIHNEAIQVALLGAIVLGEFGVFAYYTFRPEVSERADAWLKLRAISHGFSLFYFCLKMVIRHLLNGLIVEGLAEQICTLLGGAVLLEYLAYAVYRYRERHSAVASVGGWRRDEFTEISVVIFVVITTVAAGFCAVWFSHSIIMLACVAVLAVIVGTAYVYFSAEKRRREYQTWAQPSRSDKSTTRPAERLPNAQTQVSPPNQPTRRNIINPFVNPTRAPIPVGPTAQGMQKPDPPKPGAKVPRPEDAPPMMIQGSDFRLTKPEVVSLELITEDDRLPLYCRGLGSLNELDIVVWWPVERMNRWKGNEVLALTSIDVQPDPIMRVVVINFRENSQIVIPQSTTAKLPDATAT